MGAHGYASALETEARIEKGIDNGAKSEIDKAIQILEFINQNFDTRWRIEAA